MTTLIRRIFNPSRCYFSSAMSANYSRVQRFAATCVQKPQWDKVRLLVPKAQPFFAPLTQQNKERINVQPAFSKEIFITRRPLLIKAPVNQFRFLQPFQPVSQHTARYAEIALKFIKSTNAEEHFLKYRESPSITENLQRLFNGNRAGRVKTMGHSIVSFGVKNRLSDIARGRTKRQLASFGRKSHINLRLYLGVT